MLSAKNISYHIGKARILENISADFLPGEFTMILGPNGSGKSSFLKIFSGETSHFEGAVYYDDVNLQSIKKETLATYRAVMSQQPELSFPLTVEEVVLMGRYPHFTFNPAKRDIQICNDALDLMQLAAFKHRNYTTLSGGEKQRVQYARVLAQIWEAPAKGLRYLFLDEPLNNLDIKYQQDFLKTACSFKNNNTVLVAVMHDINLAIQYADKLIFFKQGKIRAAGKPSVVVTHELIKEIFEVDVTVIENSGTAAPFLLYR